MQDIVGVVTYSCGPLHMDEQRHDDQLEPTYNRSVPIQDISLKTFRERWTIEKGGGKRFGRSSPEAQHNDDDDDDMTVKFRAFQINIHEHSILLM